MCDQTGQIYREMGGKRDEVNVSIIFRCLPGALTNELRHGLTGLRHATTELRRTLTEPRRAAP
jgi:hypothetical protein